MSKPTRDYKEMQRRNGAGLMESMEVRQLINNLEAAEKDAERSHRVNKKIISELKKRPTRSYHGLVKGKLAKAEALIKEISDHLNGVLEDVVIGAHELPDCEFTKGSIYAYKQLVNELQAKLKEQE